jgi:predicted transcriptional regulator
MLTAVSLYELPSSEVLREALTGFLDRHPRASDVLRGFADMLDAGEIPVGPAPIHEHDEYLRDYRDQVHRKAFRVPEETRDRLRALSFATGLAQTAIIRLALNQAVSTAQKEPADPDQLG